ncbi:MAG: MATE family efflux transporter [Candidatus Brocadiae bacterium]|nr:MATE family efflux transporter [Candidatus Brocadiia bacterium]
MNLSSSSIDRTKIPLSKLVLPMFVENIIRTSLMSVDQLMLYAYSEKAVAAISVVSQMAFFIQLIYMMVTMGASIHISQNLGAGNRKEAGLICLGSFVLIGILSTVLSFFVFLFAAPILRLFPLETKVYEYAWQFLTIYGCGSIFMALNIVQAAILRSYGHPKDPMAVNAIALAFTIGGNALCLFGPFGFPIFGVIGVAIVTVISQFIALWIMGSRIQKHKDIEIPFQKIREVPKYIYRKILEVGIPTAGENISYNTSQIFITSMIASLGTDSLAAYSLVITLSRYVFISGVSIGMGTQIKVGYFVGSGQYEEAQKRVYRYFSCGIAISIALVILLNIFKQPVLAFFTQNPQITAIASAVFLVSLVLEPGRNLNTIITPGLKGAGDVRFPVIIGIFSMWFVGVGCAYLFGIRLGLGLIGVWIGMAADEWLRGLLMLSRWYSGAWKNKSLVK